MAASHSSSSQKTWTNTSTVNKDNRVTGAGSGDVFALTDSKFTLGKGATFNFTSSNGDVAKAAIAAVSGTAQALAAGSNAIASEVAASQEKFLSTATGQKTLIWVVGGVLAIALIPALMGGKKS